MAKDKRLNGNNYPLWAYRMKQSFLDKKVWYVVRDDVPPTATAHGLIELGRAPFEANLHIARTKSLYMLSKAVDDRILACFTRIDDPSLLWGQLREWCASNTNTCRSILKRRLTGFHFSDSLSMT